ncbi:MAG: T9SS type A sorting domain-containing protein [Aureispira sp.]
MKKYIKLGLLLACSNGLLAQHGLTNHGATIQVEAQTTLTITQGSLINQTKGSILNAGQISLEKDWKQEDKEALYTGAGSLLFNGKNDQSIVSASELVIHQLVIDNGHQLDLKAPIQITQQADLSNNSQLVLNNHHCTLAPTAVVVNYDEQHYVITNKKGCLQQQVGEPAALFPVGNAHYNPIVVQNRGTEDQFSIRVEKSEEEPSNTVAAIWFVKEAITGGSLANFQVQWELEQEGSQFIREEAGVAFWHGASWLVPSIASSSWNSQLSTQTTKEVTKMGPIRVQSKDRSSLVVSSTENEPFKQANTVQAFPNPVETHLHIRSDVTLKEASIEVLDSKGSLLLQTTQTIEAGNLFQLEGMADWPEGLYWVHIRKGNTTVFSQKIVKK